MARMQFVRPFDLDRAVETGHPGYRAHVLSHLESALMIVSHIEAGGCGPAMHYHRSDQIYYLTSGSMTVRLGDDEHRADAGSLVFIPAGLAHCNRNDGEGPETHLEIITPAPGPLDRIALFVDSPDDVPAEHRTSRAGYVRRTDPAAAAEPLPGLFVQNLADPGSGSVHAVVNHFELAPGSAGPGTHIHAFDQYYFVLEGQLTVEVALQEHVVDPGSLVLLPAGVPHRQYNGGDRVERHLAVLAPAPEPGEPWDRGVDFAPNGITHSGADREPAQPVAASAATP